MTIDDKFEVIRNEEEHKNNGLHKELKMWYNHYLKMGCTKQHAIRYAYWNLRNNPESKYYRGKGERK